MRYNTDLQTNNTNLQEVLTKIENLSEESEPLKETWTLTDVNGNVSTTEISMLNRKDVCLVSYSGRNGITVEDCYISNKVSCIKRGTTYTTIIQNINPEKNDLTVVSIDLVSGYISWGDTFYAVDGICKIAIDVDETVENMTVYINYDTWDWGED